MSSFYAAVGVIIENSDGEILMVQEGKNHIHGKWDFPGGGWKDRESIIECVKREVMEETGFKVDIDGFLGVYKELNQKDRTETIAFMFTGRPVEKAVENPNNEGEIIETSFFSPSKVRELDLRVENRKEILDRYLEEEYKPIDVLWNDLNLIDSE
jgi:ADP-ribose pyrophosphatase YjhB (NUDIX family)